MLRPAERRHGRHNVAVSHLFWCQDFNKDGCLSGAFKVLIRPLKELQRAFKSHSKGLETVLKAKAFERPLKGIQKACWPFKGLTEALVSP